MANVSTARPQNRLLAALPDADFARVRERLETVGIAPKQMVHAQGEGFEHVYFPNGGVYSMVTAFADGTRVESVTVGKEGMVGLAALFSDDPISPCETVLQVPDGNAHRMSVAAFRREMAESRALRNAVGRYAEAVMAHNLQSTACNAHHPAQERCARWLLMTHDRVQGDEFDLSHEYLAMMLGVSRQSVSIVAGTLQAAGLIRYRHGRITIVDRKALEAAACECYGTIRAVYDRLR